MKIEFDYCIVKKGVITDTCYAFAELSEEEMEDIADGLMEANSTGEMTDMPEECLGKFVDAALDDAAAIYPNFADEKAGFGVMLQKYLPDDLVDLLPDGIVENFSPDMFEEGGEEKPGEETEGAQEP